MRSNVKLGRVSGIEIGLHYSWFIIAALIVFSLGEHFRQVNPNWSNGETWAVALFTAVLFFVSLLLHELAHSLVAQARGLRVRPSPCSLLAVFPKFRTMPPTRRRNSGSPSPVRSPA